MAQVKVIDLSKYEERGEELSNKEKINYMIVKAKDQVNAAFKVLFAKDSKLHRVEEIGFAKKSLEEVIEKRVGDLDKLKIGTIIINGLSTIALKKVVNLNPQNIKDLKSNLSVFG